VYKHALSFKPLSQLPDSTEKKKAEPKVQKKRIVDPAKLPEVIRRLQKRNYTPAELARRLNLAGFRDTNGRVWKPNSVKKLLPK
jgi:hypothetical protein